MSDAHQAIADGIRAVAMVAAKKRTRIRPELSIVEDGSSPAEAEEVAEVAEPAEGEVTTKVFVPILKAEAELQIVTGVVLQPEVVDAHGDIIGVDVIRETAHKFLTEYNRRTKLKLQHKDFKPGRFDLVESFIAPVDLAIGSKVVKAGSWVMSVKVNDKAIWQKVKDGKITGFSIGGRAKVKTLAA